MHPRDPIEPFKSEAPVICLTATHYPFGTSPDPFILDSNTIITSQNGFTITFLKSIPHLGKVLESLMLSIHVCPSFIKSVDGEHLNVKEYCLLFYVDKQTCSGHPWSSGLFPVCLDLESIRNSSYPKNGHVLTTQKLIQPKAKHPQAITTN